MRFASRIGRLTPRQQQIGFTAANRGYALSVPDEKADAAREHLDRMEAAIPAGRKKRKEVLDGVDIDAIHGTKRTVPLEADTIHAIAKLLAVHPLVLFAVRQNSGSLPYMTAAGKYAPVWFYKWAKRPYKMRVTDFWFVLNDGRIGAIECKRENWRGPTDDSEREQEAFIECVKAAGGIGGFARSATEAAAIMESGHNI